MPSSSWRRGSNPEPAESPPSGHSREVRMANPSYPQMGQMPMGAPPPMGPPTMNRPMRRGVSKAVPVVVSAGLAVGVFCGLLFGLGTDKDEANAAPAKTE